MTTLEELVSTEPDATHGVEIQIPASSGAWRWAVELADPEAGESVVFHDVTMFYQHDRSGRGADEYMGRYKAGVVNVRLQIDNVQAAELGLPVDILAGWGQDTSALFGVNIAPLDAGLIMRGGLFRVDGGVTVEWHPTWTGRVEFWDDASAAGGKLRWHDITVLDTLSDLVNVKTSAAEEPWDENHVATLFEGADWLWGYDLYGSSISPDVPAQTSVPAEQAIDNACDPMGLVWRTRRNGRAVVHPAPFDELHSVAWPNPLLDEYPGGLVFNYNPGFSEIEYITDDDQQPFGISRSSRGSVRNQIVATFPGPTVYPVDDPVSQGKYGIKPLDLTWIVENEAAVNQILSARAFATAQALPLRTNIDHEGFFPAMVMIDHLDPVTIVHANSEDGLVVTAVGRVRHITEERELRHGNALSWKSAVQVDIDATESSVQLLPVENLALLFAGPNFAQTEWDLPTQVLTPTEVQVRVTQLSTIWSDRIYPTVAWTSPSLTPETEYTFQVRLVRRVNGIITNASPVREITFTTAAPELPTPTPGPDPDETDVDFPDPEPGDPDCVAEIDLQENDGTGWVTIDTFSGSEIYLGEDGQWHLTTPIDNSVFDDDKLYRFVGRAVCDGTPGPDIIGPTFDPPDDWEDPCPTPPALAEAPFDSEDLLAYVPQICSPNLIAEAVSGIHGVWDSGFGDILQEVGEPNRFALESNADGGIIAHGECNQPPVGSKTITIRVHPTEAEFVTFYEWGAMRLTCTPSGSGFKGGATVFTADGTGTCLSSELPLDATYVLKATYDATTGDLKLYVDDVEDGDTTFGEARDTINALPTWFAGAPPNSWVTDAASFDGVLEPPAFDVLDLPGLAGWYDASDTGTITGGGAVSQWDDKSGASHELVQGTATNRPASGTRTQNSLNVVDFDGVDNYIMASTGPAPTGGGGLTIFAVFKADNTTDTSAGLLTMLNGGLNANDLNGVMFDLRGGGGGGRHSIAIGEGSSSSSAGDYEAHQSSVGALTTSPCQVNLRVSTSGFTYRLNGSLLGLTPFSGAGTFSFLANLAGGTLRTALGTRTGNAWPFDGWIGEVIICTGLLSDTDVTACEAYLADKWGL